MHRHLPPLAAVIAGAMATAFSAPVAAQKTNFGAVVEVNRLLTEVRVVDRDDLPVPDLRPDEFEVSIDGDPVEVESVTWVPASAEVAVSAKTQAAGDDHEAWVSRAAPEGRLIILVFQTDMALRHSRTAGLIKTAPLAADFVDNLGPDDKVAVFVFGTHLELRSDFTADHQAIAEAVQVQEILGGEQAQSDTGTPSLIESFDFAAARDAADMSSAFEVIARSLENIPGAKSLVFFGFGLGRMSAGQRITVGDGYDRTIQALANARCSVFSVDLTEADYHSLEHGQRKISDDTGGLYIKTFHFPEIAMQRLVRVISSYYELSIVPPPDLAESFKIKVKVTRPGTTVYVRQNHPSK